MHPILSVQFVVPPAALYGCFTARCCPVRAIGLRWPSCRAGQQGISFVAVLRQVSKANINESHATKRCRRAKEQVSCCICEPAVGACCVKSGCQRAGCAACAGHCSSGECCIAGVGTRQIWCLQVGVTARSGTVRGQQLIKPHRAVHFALRLPAGPGPEMQCMRRGTQRKTKKQRNCKQTASDRTNTLVILGGPGRSARARPLPVPPVAHQTRFTKSLHGSRPLALLARAHAHSRG